MERDEKPALVATFVVKGEELTQEQMQASLAFADLGGTELPRVAVKLDTTVEVERGQSSRAWLVRAAVTGLPPRSSARRFVRLSLGTTDWSAPYTLTSLPPTGFSLPITAPASPWLVWDGPFRDRRATSLLVAAAGGPASGLRLVQASLRDSLQLSEIGLDDLELCKAVADKDCDAGISLESQATETLWLRLKRSPTDAWWKHRLWPLGKYSGTVSLSVDELAQPQTINVVVHASSWLAWAVGLLLLLAGTLVGWWSNVWARERVARLEALRAVAVVSASIAAVRRSAEAAPAQLAPQIAGLTRVLNELDTDLTSDELDKRGLLPPEIPWAFKATADSSAALKDHLAKVASHLAGLHALVRDGYQPLWARWLKAEPGGQTRGYIESALEALNLGAGVTTDEAKALKVVQDVLAELSKREGRQPDFAGAIPSSEVGRHLTWEIGRIQRAGWWLWVVLNVIAGAAVLMLPNSGFGTLLDLLFCLFWGLGLPVAVDRLQALGPGGVAGSIGVTLPKGTA